MIRRMLRRLHQEEDGFSAGLESLAFGVLIFLAGSVIVINGWSVLDADFAANAAAREATRAVVESSLSQADARQLARNVAEETLSGHGKNPDDATVAFLTDPWAGSPSGNQLVRCARVTIEVRYEVPLITMPFVGAFAPVDAIGEHTELVDPLRSGLTGEATCA